MHANRDGRAYERYGWVILLASALPGLLFAVAMTFAPNAILSEPEFRAGVAPELIRAWGVTWVGFSVFALVLILNSYRKRERWSWYAAWLLPLLWLSHFILAPDTPHNLVLAVVTALGLILQYRLFFPAERRPSQQVE